MTSRFGAHVIARKSYTKISGVELYLVGQKGVIGRYPIHFHMARDVSAFNCQLYSNSIHNTFSRCITIHSNLLPCSNSSQTRTECR